MPCFWTIGISFSSSPRASKPQSQRTTSSTDLASWLMGRRLSPLVPARIDPGGDLGLPFEELSEELLDPGIGRERLRLLGALPDVDAQEVALIHGIQEDLVGDVPRLLRHLLGGAGDLVVDLLHGGLVALQPGPDRDRHSHDQTPYRRAFGETLAGCCASI